MAEVAPHVLRYREVRLRGCRAALGRAVRRYGTYLVLGVLLLAGFSANAAGAPLALAALSVAPLAQQAQAPDGWPFVAGAVHALPALGVVLLASPWLWPGAWRELERALPIGRAERLRSDSTVTAWVLLPLAVLYVVGLASWSAQAPGWTPATQARAWGALAESIVLGWLAGAAALQVRRCAWPPRGRRRMGSAGGRSGLAAKPGWTLAVLPLARGPARRAGRWLAATALLLAGVALLARLDGSRAGWWLAGFALLALVAGSRGRLLLETDLAPLHARCAALPLPPSLLRRWRRALALLPAGLGTLMLAALFLPGGAPVRPPVLAAFAGACLAGNLWQVLRPPQRAEGVLASWLLTLVITVALATEVSA